ncbi:MAG: hypothetical protein K1X55_13620 [Chitinophagales bacterium]|nr:hypothetical protein [Chitinophagales bacterium]
MHRIFFWIVFFFFGCHQNKNEYSFYTSVAAQEQNNLVEYDSSAHTIHLYVALCDNKYQGIVPVPKNIGNGQDADNNLYWGCAYGVRTYFKNSHEWTLVKTEKPDSIILERLVFKNKSSDYYLVAEAYNGKYINKCTDAFLSASAGLLKDTMTVNGRIIGTNGNAALIAYIGHDGLMDFDLAGDYVNTDGIQRKTIILACYSSQFFAPELQNANVQPLLWSTGLMSPEAYTLHDALSGYIAGKTSVQIRDLGASAYAKYQGCSKTAALRLLKDGW